MSKLFPKMKRSVSLRSQIDCVNRELRMRERVFPKRDAEGKMSPLLAKEQTELMRAVLETLWALHEEEPKP